MKILILSFYYSPDLCPGSFRARAFVDELKTKLSKDDEVEIVTTMPNRYSSYKVEALKREEDGNVIVNRIEIPSHKSGMVDQAKSFYHFFSRTLKLTKSNDYDMVFATSSRLFTAFLGAYISRKKNIPLYLDIRDIFVDTIKSVLKERKFGAFFPFFLLKSLEKYTFRRAKRINLVSKGFKEYFEKIAPKVECTYYFNGIDNEFLDYDFSHPQINDKIVVTYAGNIGAGQGLYNIIPKVAKEVEDIVEFRIIGDGGERGLLKKELVDYNLKNVIIINPVSRVELLEYYAKSDILFVHLNNLKAFEKVLPSKIFEYAVTNKFIVAGVKGFAKEFLENNVEDVFIFEPQNHNDLVNFLKQYKRKSIDRTSFKSKYSRDEIMKEYVNEFIYY